jgi:surface protein
MFEGCTLFNQDLSSWDTSNVINLNFLLQNCPAFDQDLSSWNISSLTQATNFLINGQLSTANYDALLIGWEAGPHNNNVSFHAGSSTYSAGAATTARTTLDDDDSWTFTDGGPA